MGHNRNLIVRDHVGDHVARNPAAPRQSRIEFIASDGIEEGIDPLVHPGPLPLVRIDRHREIDVPDFVDHDAQQEHLFRQRIGARPILVKIGARPVEGNHRVFHPAHRPVDALRGGIGIVEAEARIDLHRVDHGGGRIFLPQLAAFLGVEGHRHHGLVLGTRLVVALRVPGELAARRPGEIAHVLCGIAPGLRARCAATLVGLRLLRGHDEDGRVGGARPLQTLDLLRCQDLRRVLQHAGGRHDVIVRHGDRDIVIAEFQRELPPPQKLLIMPAFIVRIGDHSRKPLGHQEDVVAARARIVGEMFVTRSRIDRVFLDDVEIPFDHELDALPRRERDRQIDPHQRADNGALQFAAADQPQRSDVVAEFIVRHGLLTAQFLQRQARGLAAAGIADRRTAPPRPAEVVGQFGHGIGAEDVLVELHPQPGQRIGRIVRIADRGARTRPAAILVERCFDRIIGFLLPILVPRRARRIAIDIRRRQHFVELPELVLERALGLLDPLRSSGHGQDHGAQRDDFLQWFTPFRARPFRSKQPVRQFL